MSFDEFASQDVSCLPARLIPYAGASAAVWAAYRNPRPVRWRGPKLPPAPAVASPALVSLLPLSIRAVSYAVSREFGVSMADLISHRRFWHIARPRQVAMYLAEKLTGKSLPQIGLFLGGRDHTTVLHGVRRIAAMLACDPELAARVGVIEWKVVGADG